MNKNVLVGALRAAALSSKEAHIYLALLETGAAPVSTIAKAAGLNRVTTYGVLEKMAEKNAVHPLKRHAKQYFQAVDPAVLLQQARQQTAALASSLPALQATMSQHTAKPQVRFFDGLSGLKQAYLETLSSQGEILNYADSQNIRDHWPEYDQDYVQQRVSKSIFLRGIYPRDTVGEQIQHDDAAHYRQTRLVERGQFWVENEVKIFDHTVLIASFHPHPFAILIDSPTVTQTQRSLFEMLWQTAGAE